jgi:hypothetical protein
MKIEKETLDYFIQHIKTAFEAPGIDLKIPDPFIGIKKNPEENDMHPVGTRCMVFADISSDLPELKNESAYFVVFEGDENPCFILKGKIEATDEKPEIV